MTQVPHLSGCYSREDTAEGRLLKPDTSMSLGLAHGDRGPGGQDNPDTASSHLESLTEIALSKDIQSLRHTYKPSFFTGQQSACLGITTETPTSLILSQVSEPDKTRQVSPPRVSTD